MSESKLAQVRAAIEEELGGLRQFAGLNSAELEAAAARIARGIEAYVADDERGEERISRSA